MYLQMGGPPLLQRPPQAEGRHRQSMQEMALEPQPVVVGLKCPWYQLRAQAQLVLLALVLLALVLLALRLLALVPGYTVDSSQRLAQQPPDLGQQQFPLVQQQVESPLQLQQQQQQVQQPWELHWQQLRLLRQQGQWQTPSPGAPALLHTGSWCSCQRPTAARGQGRERRQQQQQLLVAAPLVLLLLLWPGLQLLRDLCPGRPVAAPPLGAAPRARLPAVPPLPRVAVLRHPAGAAALVGQPLKPVLAVVEPRMARARQPGPAALSCLPPPAPAPKLVQLPAGLVLVL